MGKSKNKYHKPTIKSEKAFDTKINTGISPSCYCNSAGGSGFTNCRAFSNYPNGF